MKNILLFIEAWFLLATARILLLFFSFSSILPLLGKPVSTHMEATQGKKEFFLLRLAIHRASKYSIFRAMCFEQAICAKVMLKMRNRKSTILFGVKTNESTGKFSAHAWLICNRELVTGGSQIAQFKVLAEFFS